MDWIKEFGNEYENPLDKLSDGISNTAIFRSIAFIGDSLSSGEFETVDADGIRHYYDMYEYSWGQYIARKNGLKAYNNEYSAKVEHPNRFELNSATACKCQAKMSKNAHLKCTITERN